MGHDGWICHNTMQHHATMQNCQISSEFLGEFPNAVCELHLTWCQVAPLHAARSSGASSFSLDFCSFFKGNDTKNGSWFIFMYLSHLTSKWGTQQIRTTYWWHVLWFCRLSQFHASKWPLITGLVTALKGSKHCSSRTPYEKILLDVDRVIHFSGR